jgi:sugar/nucleoside kinase (ribokinase family)
MEPAPRSFDVICAGEVLWHLRPASPTTGGGIRFRPGGGAVDVALELARRGLRVGLATVLDDDAAGRGLRVAIGRAGIDASGIVLAASSSSVLLLDGRAAERPVASAREEERPVVVPATWSSPVLLLAGLSPVVAYAASLCKAARAARRAGTCVVVDVNARWHLWAGRDARATYSILREADVVHGSMDDLAALGLDEARVRAAMRPSAVLVVTNPGGAAWASGPFGEVGGRSWGLHDGAVRGEPVTAAVCAELARAGYAAEGRADLWHRALSRGQTWAATPSARA